MPPSSYSRKFDKETPGAETVFQPPDLHEYANDEWDIRISLGDAPVAEAFYFTMDDPRATDRTIRELLDDYALNPAFRDRLDVDEYPDLPFLQEELIQYRTSEAAGQLSLEYFINKNPIPGPVNLDQPAGRYLSVVTSHDGTDDYRVLDLVLVAEVPPLDRYERKQLRDQFGSLFLLMLLEYHSVEGGGLPDEFTNEEVIRSYLTGFPDANFPSVGRGLDELKRDGFLFVVQPSDALKIADEGTLGLTEKGREAVEDIRREFIETADTYDCYESVSLAPPALGVPGGFDARVQMMEFDGIDYIRAVLLQILGQSRDAFFATGEWQETFESFFPAATLREALAFKTNFSAEVLTLLKQIAEHEGGTQE